MRDSQVFYKGGVELQLGKMELVSKGINQYLEIKLIATLKNSGNVHPNILLKYINTTGNKSLIQMQTYGSNLY